VLSDCCNLRADRVPGNSAAPFVGLVETKSFSQIVEVNFKLTRFNGIICINLRPLSASYFIHLEEMRNFLFVTFGGWSDLQRLVQSFCLASNLNLAGPAICSTVIGPSLAH